MPLRATAPHPVEKRLKMFLFGPPGSRKTTSAIQFPQSVLIDMERGSEDYLKSIKKAGSIVLQTTNPDEVRDEIKTLLTEKHEYRTLILDPVTIFYEGLQDKWTRLFEKHTDNEKNKELQDFGMRYWGRVKSEYKSMLRMLLKLDMNIIMTAHQKDIYGSNMSKVGVGPDSMKGDNYFFDNVFQLSVGGGKAIATTIKQRSEPLDPPKFPEQFEWSYENFLKFYGKDIIERQAVPVAMASPAQVEEIKRLVSLVNIDEATIDSWFTKADVSEWSEMTSDTITKCITAVKKKLENAKVAA
jgi:hypothetical protein